MVATPGLRTAVIGKLILRVRDSDGPRGVTDGHLHVGFVGHDVVTLHRPFH